MKRKGNLFPTVCDEATIVKAIMCASKGKRRRSDVRKVLENKEFYAHRLHIALKDGTFKPSPYRTETVLDGTHMKQREIFKPCFFPDQVVHWCIYLAIRDWIYRGMYEFSCGSVPGKGMHYGRKYLQRWIERDHKNTKYYLKMDVRKFYPSIKPDRLMGKLRRTFKDERLLQLIELVLSQSDGLPIGMLLSQVLANFFMNNVDHAIKQQLGAVYYIRYMDDMVILGRNKRKLHRMREAITEMLEREGLQLKGNWQVCRLDSEPLDFMGFRFYRGHVALRRSIMLRITRKVRKVSRKGRFATLRDACAVVSYMGWLRHTNSHNLYVTRIKPFLHLARMKAIIRREQHAAIHKHGRQPAA